MVEIVVILFYFGAHKFSKNMHAVHHLCIIYALNCTKHMTQFLLDSLL